MNRKKWIAFALACGMMASLTGQAAVMGSDDVFIGDDPYSGSGDVPQDQYQDPNINTDPGVDVPPATEPPATEPPATEPPATEPPATEPPATEQPATEQPATEQPATEDPGTSGPVYVPEDPAPNYGGGGSDYYGNSGGSYNNGGSSGNNSGNESRDDSGDDSSSKKSSQDKDNLDYSIFDFELFDAEDAKRDFDLPDADALPNQIYLRVPEIFQEPELPTGCEVTSLSMVLQYEEIKAEKTELADEYLIYNREDDNLAVGYVGDPYDVTGAGCFAPALTATADAYFKENELDYRAYDITDTDFEDLFAYVASGTPVMVWTTMYMDEPDFTGEVGVLNDREYPWYRQEHCVVLSGYNLSEGTVQVNDPIEGILDRDMEAFASIYEKTGKNAVVIKEQEKEAETDAGQQAPDQVSVSAVSTQTETPAE